MLYCTVQVKRLSIDVWRVSPSLTRGGYGLVVVNIRVLRK